MMIEKENGLKIKKISVPDLVCEEMKSLILNNVWESGQKIPSEGELAETFGVNRFTIRMALQKLNTIGILDTRRGDGTYVCPFNFEAHIKDLSVFYMTPKLLNDVTEFRILIEVECARLAILRATDEELERLKSCCEVFERDVTAYVNSPRESSERKDFYQRFNDSDLAIHSQVSKMSHNELLIYSFSTAKEAIREHMSTIGHKRVCDLSPGEDIASVSAHWGIYYSIKEKDFERCSKILLNMINHN